MPAQAPPSSPTSAIRAWCYLVWLSIQQQARVRLMLGVSLVLLALMAFLVIVTTALDGWQVRHWRSGRRQPTFQQHLEAAIVARHALALNTSATAGNDAIIAAVDKSFDQSGFMTFSRAVVFSIFATFLLPLWTLSFGTEGLGREREAGNIIWLLTRPLNRPAVYLAKFVAILPWSLSLNLGGFALLCLLAGAPGRLALRLYWPAIFWGTIAFSALFHLMGAWFRRPAVIAILYSFFLETLMGNMPGYLKRASISFYSRCLMFDAAADYNLGPVSPSIYLPVSGTTAWLVLAGVTTAFLLVGMIVFSQREYLQADT